MHTFTTETGSMYEIDPVDRRVRRVTGTNEPTVRQGDDGQWQTYRQLLVMRWPDGAVGLFFDWTGLGNGTYTSPIVNPSAAEVLDWCLGDVADA